MAHDNHDRPIEVPAVLVKLVASLRDGELLAPQPKYLRMAYRWGRMTSNESRNYNRNEVLLLRMTTLLGCANR